MTWVRFLLAWNAVWLFVWLLLCVSRADAAWYADPAALARPRASSAARTPGYRKGGGGSRGAIYHTRSGSTDCSSGFH